jgi:hypothetical protein
MVEDSVYAMQALCTRAKRRGACCHTAHVPVVLVADRQLLLLLLLLLLLQCSDQLCSPVLLKHSIWPSDAANFAPVDTATAAPYCYLFSSFLRPTLAVTLTL